jgi:hypothetical protein
VDEVEYSLFQGFLLVLKSSGMPVVSQCSVRAKPVPGELKRCDRVDLLLKTSDALLQIVLHHDRSIWDFALAVPEDGSENLFQLTLSLWSWRRVPCCIRW